MTYCRKGVSLLIAALLVGTWGLKASAAERASTRSAVPFVSGGVGEEALVRLKARENEFNLKLVFTPVSYTHLTLPTNSRV